MPSFPAIDFNSNPGLFSALLDAALRSLLVAFAVWAGLRLLRAHNVVTQKAAWGLVLAGALLMPVVAPWAARLPWLPAKAMLVLPARSWLQAMSTRAATRADVAQTQAAVPPQNDSALNPDLAPYRNPSPAPPPAWRSTRTALSVAPLHTADRFPAPTISSSSSSGSAVPETTETGWQFQLPSLGTMAWLLYFTVFAGLLLRLLYGVGAAAGIWQSAEPVDLDIAPELTHGLHLRSSDKLRSPVTVGSGILLPADYSGWNSEKLRIVLAHERSHVKQRDFYLQLCAGLYAALFWFSPLGWWLKRKLSDLSEAISDRAGLSEAASRASYAQVLLEFAAMPRTTQIGVAMARPGRLTHRIERLLNESSFRQSFAGGRRMLVALLLVPAALFAATALIRVEAAGQAPKAPTPPPTPAVLAKAPVTAPAPVAPVSPDVAPVQAEAAPQSPKVPPSPAGPSAMPATPRPPSAKIEPDMAPEPPEPPEVPGSGDMYVTTDDRRVLITPDGRTMSAGRGRGRGNSYSYSFSNKGDSYAIIRGKGDKVQMSGDWLDGHKEAIEKAKRMAHGDFLWFTRDGKSYIIEDPEKLAQIEAMYKPMDDLGHQQAELGRQQEALGRQQEELGRKQELASIPTPDISKEMAALNAAVAKMQAQKSATLTQEQLSDLEGKIGELQGKLGGLQGEIGAKMGLIGGQQGKLGQQQGELGARQGRIGAEQGRIAMEADRKVKSIIDESLKNGKAKPVN